MAIVLPPPAPATPVPLVGAPAFGAPAAALSGCATCFVRHYCAMYSPANVAPPANCPFGPGPTSRSRA